MPGRPAASLLSPPRAPRSSQEVRPHLSRGPGAAHTDRTVYGRADGLTVRVGRRTSVLTEGRASRDGGTDGQRRRDGRAETEGWTGRNGRTGGHRRVDGLTNLILRFTGNKFCHRDRGHALLQRPRVLAIDGRVQRLGVAESPQRDGGKSLQRGGQVRDGTERLPMTWADLSRRRGQTAAGGAP